MKILITGYNLAKIEDNLSDILHKELTKSFIDKRISVLSRNLKQEVKLNTVINEKDDVIIDKQLIGKLRALKLNLEFTSETLDTDIKSLKKAARQGIADELVKRVEKIINEKDIFLDSSYKILWKNNPIAKIKRDKNYLSPEIEIIADEALDLDAKGNLLSFLNNWLSQHIFQELRDLVNLVKLENTKSVFKSIGISTL